MKTLGIDIGTAITGWSVVEWDPVNRSKYKVLGYGAILTSSKLPMPARLGQIYTELEDIIKKYKPAHMAVEDLFFFKNQKTVIKVGQARGVVIVCGINNGLQVFDYTPLQVKQAVTSYGRAEKRQVQEMVTRILGLKEVPKPDDVADALAVAVCHLNTL
jgi:crossover junction endodeoxyribonuclease RuvC